MSQSGGVNIDANEVNVGQDVVGRDKITNIIVPGDAAALLKQIGLQPAAKRPQPLRILAAIAAPVAGLTDDERAPVSLSGRAEWAALRRASTVAPIRLARLRPPTEASLRATCSPNNKGQFNIVHFICHGLPGALALEDERGLTRLIDAHTVAAALRDGGVQLAVVNACYSAAGATRSLAKALVEAGVKAVIAHRQPLIDPAAVLFSNALYRELAAGRTLQVAFDQAVSDTTAKYPQEKDNAVLEGDSALTFPRGDGDVPGSQVFEGPSLPDESARFFGRGRELLQLADILADPDLHGAALTGIGGIGKSALAFEAADRSAWRFRAAWPTSGRPRLA